MDKKEQINITSLTNSFANAFQVNKNLVDSKSISETSCQRSDISLFCFTRLYY